MNDVVLGTDRQGGQEEEQSVDAVTEDMELLGVTEEDANERVRRWQMIGCGHPKGEDSLLTEVGSGESVKTNVAPAEGNNSHTPIRKVADVHSWSKTKFRIPTSLFVSAAEFAL